MSAVDLDDSVLEQVLEEKSYEQRLREAKREFDRQVGNLRVEHKRHVYKREGIVASRYESALEETRASIHDRMEPLKRRLRATQEELLREQMTSQQLRLQLLDAEKLVKDLEIDVVRARSGLPPESAEASSPNISVLRRKVERLRTTILDQTAELAKSAKTNQELETKCHELQQKYDESQIARMKAENLVKDLERRLARKTEELDAALKTRTADRAGREDAVAEANRLKHTVRDKEDDVKSLTAALENAQKELQAMKQKYEDVTTKLQAELKKERNTNLELEAKIRSLTSQLEREKAKVNEEQRLRKEAEKQAKKLKEQAEKWERKVDELEDEIAKLEKTVRILDSRKL